MFIDKSNKYKGSNIESSLNLNIKIWKHSKINGKQNDEVKIQKKRDKKVKNWNQRWIHKEIWLLSICFQSAQYNVLLEIHLANIDI